jgi:hypothetical protein
LKFSVTENKTKRERAVKSVGGVELLARKYVRKLFCEYLCNYIWGDTKLRSAIGRLINYM